MCSICERVSPRTYLERPWLCPSADFSLPLRSDLMGADDQGRPAALNKNNNGESSVHKPGTVGGSGASAGKGREIC